MGVLDIALWCGTTRRDSAQSLQSKLLVKNVSGVVLTSTEKIYIYIYVYIQNLKLY